MNRFSSGTAAFLALGITASAVAPIVISLPATAQTSFSDIRNHWARPFIETLATERIISGYQNSRNFKPDQPVTRAEFAALVQAAFPEQAEVRSSGGTFNDVPTKHWARDKIQKAYRTGFMSGYTRTNFRPDLKIPRVQALVSLASGLELEPQGSTTTILRNFRDADDIPDYAIDKIVAATENGMVVNHPSVNNLDPNKNATRAEVAAFIYQAMVHEKQLDPISSSETAARYIVGGTSGNNQATGLRVPRNTTISVLYEPTDKLVVTPSETVNITLRVAADVKNSQGDVLIPRDSEIEGQLIPRYNGSQFLGTQFVADNLIVGNQSYDNLNVASSLLTGQKPSTVSQQTLGNVALTTAAQAILARATGQTFNVGDILTSILTGQAPSTGAQQDNLIIIDPEKDLKLTVGSEFYLNSNTRN